MLKKVLLTLMVMSMLLLIPGCSNSGQQASTVTETPVVTPEITATPEPTPTEPPVFNPDFVVPNPKTRPVSVMIDNQGDRVLPQGGISQAQIVYEMLVEYNITRFMAFFWDTMPEMIGPVRSSRHYFLDYALEYDAVYTHFGWSEYARKDISKLKIQNINGLVNGAAFWDLTKDRGNWQDSYTSGERIQKQIETLKYRTEPQKPFPFTYEEQFTVPQNGDTAENVSIKFSSNGGSNCGFVYNTELGMYERFRMGQPHMERNTGKQVLVTNIIVEIVSAPPIKGDPEGRRNLENIGSGEGWFITAGKAIPIKWSKTARDEQTTFTTEDGKPITLNRGQTWIELVPSKDYVEIK